MFIADPSGRKDPAGRPVGFYPATRSLQQAKSQSSAAKSTGTGKVHENPQNVKQQ
jgi:hypothetical protein